MYIKLFVLSPVQKSYTNTKFRGVLIAIEIIWKQEEGLISRAGPGLTPKGFCQPKMTGLAAELQIHIYKLHLSYWLVL